ncbi:MAG: alpha/beta fold hydrolase [Cardiobacterium sp.]
MNPLRRALGALLLPLALIPAFAADLPPAQEHEWIIPNYTFKNGETLPELHLHYTTLGDPKGEPVLILHGTTGSARSMLKDGFADELYGAGQPLDASKYYLILPDAIGTGKSSKPSDGLRMKFPAYDYDDMVEAQYRLVTEHLGIKHLRLILGNSMGGMHAWMWATDHPEMMDIAVPMAAYPSEMAGRNWMMRRLLVDAIKSDPGWQNGNYREQPPNFHLTYLFFTTATNGGDQALHKTGATREKADAYLQERLAAPFNADSNDYIYQWEASRNYNPAPKLDNIRATVLAINAADDERNPRALGIMEREMPRVKNGREIVIPADETTRGHGTVMQAKRWKDQLADVLANTPRTTH